MTITLKIKNGTLIEGESLCRSCRNAHIQKGFRESEEAIFCNWGDFRAVTFKVADCTDYSNRLVPYRWELEKMALLINLEPARKPAGFRSGAGFAASQAIGGDEDEDEEDSVSSMEWLTPQNERVDKIYALLTEFQIGRRPERRSHCRLLF